jgi:hypothetical protein
MYSVKRARDIRELENFLGHSHICNSCGLSFLQFEDGCPNCGHLGRVNSLKKFGWDKEAQKCPGPMDVLCFDDQGFFVKIAECWRWPRPSKDELEEMGYVEALNEEGVLEVYFFGYICPWPREERAL